MVAEIVLANLEGLENTVSGKTIFWRSLGSIFKCIAGRIAVVKKKTNQHYDKRERIFFKLV